MNIKILTIILTAISSIFASAQNGNYDERINVGNGLYKVKTHDRWGIVDEHDNLKLSVEYNEPLFMNGKAVITLFGTKQLAGVIDSVGNFTQYPPLFINTSYPFVCNDMLAVREKPTGKWGFLNTMTGELMRVQINGLKNKNKLLKSLGISGKGIKGTFIFDFVAPFVEGMAAVYSAKTGWHHIDITGKERFKNTGGTPSLFRSSLHNGECVIFGDKGIVVCKETPDKYAGVVNYLENDYEIKDYHKGLSYPYVIRTNGSRLVLNSKLQADKFENFSRGDSVILIERPRIIPKIEEKKDSFNLSRDIKVEISKRTLSASSKGTTSITINIANNGEFESDSLHFVVTVKGSAKEWNGIIPQGATQQVTLYIPAKFSSPSISRIVSWTLKDSEDELSGEETVTIKRYRPKRR